MLILGQGRVMRWHLFFFLNSGTPGGMFKDGRASTHRAISCMAKERYNNIQTIKAGTGVII